MSLSPGKHGQLLMMSSGRSVLGMLMCPEGAYLFIPSDHHKQFSFWKRAQNGSAAISLLFLETSLLSWGTGVWPCLCRAWTQADGQHQPERASSFRNHFRHSSTHFFLFERVSEELAGIQYQRLDWILNVRGFSIKCQLLNDPWFTQRKLLCTEAL